jgi:antagonist of KipI
MHFPAAVFMFTQPSLIAIAGADFAASINGDPVPDYHPVLVGKNDVLQFHKPISGARAYLSVAGGLKVENWMDSHSTNLKAKAGGFEGRVLQKDDEILLRHPGLYSLSQKDFIILPWSVDTKWLTPEYADGDNDISVLPGQEWNRLTTQSKENFTMTSFVVTQQSDRMGYRLDNIPLSCMKNEEIISTAVNFGTIQLLPDGKLILLMADHQTTGGYPRIAHIISAHHSAAAQLKAGDKINFRLTDQRAAEELYIKQQQHLLQLQNACTFRLQEYFNANRY